MNKKIIAAIAATLILICAISAFALVCCTDAEESSDVDESEVSEPSETSVDADASADTSNASKDPAEESDASADPSDEPSDEASKEQGDNISTPAENSEDEVSAAPSETSEEEASSEPEHAHTWVNATCTTPKTCKTCGETEGTTTAHDWKSATCLAPQTCKVCGTTTGSNGNHHYEDNTCTVCGDEREVIHGDTPVDIIIDGKQETVDSYEEAKELLTLEMIETAEQGYKIVIEKQGRYLTLTSNGDGTYTSSSGSTRSAQQVYDTYISQWCSDCGKRVGHGDNGTCTYFLQDTQCPYCGEFCKALECHTCDE